MAAERFDDPQNRFQPDNPWHICAIGVAGRSGRGSRGPDSDPAAPVTAPTSLNVGDQYRLVFVTSAVRDATSTNIADYIAFVSGVANGQAELAALGTS